MKRALLLSLLLLCLTGFAAAENVLLYEGGEPSIAACGGELYILCHEGLFRYDADAGAEVPVTDAVTLGTEAPGGFDELLSDGETLYGLRREDLTLIRLDTMEVAVRMEQGIARLADFVMTDDALIAVNGGSFSQLTIAFLSGDRGVQSMEDDIWSLTGYQDGQAVALVNHWRNHESEMDLAVIDLRSGEQTILGTVDAWVLMLAYDREQDELYLLDDQRVYRWTDEGLELSVYNNVGFPDEAVLFGDGLIATRTDDVVNIRRLNGAEEQNTLTVRGPMYLSDRRAMLRRHPEIVLVCEGGYETNTPERFLQDMANRDGSTDIYCFEDLDLLTRIYDEGWAAELNGSAAVRETLDAMLPAYRGFFERDGHVYAVPADICLCLPGYSPYVFEHLGVPVPTSYSELFDLLALWQEAYKDQHPEIRMDFFLDNPAELEVLLSIYAAERAAMGEPVIFNTPELAETLRQYLEASDMEARARGWEGNEDEAFINILLPHMETSDNRLHPSEVGDWLPLAVNEGAPPVITGLDIGMEYYVVNPWSPRREQALAYIEVILDGWDDRTRATLLPVAGPIVDEDGEVSVSQAELDRYRAAVDRAVIAKDNPVHAAVRWSWMTDLLDGLMEITDFLQMLDDGMAQLGQQ